jgi:hypothetical protein
LGPLGARTVQTSGGQGNGTTIAPSTGSDASPAGDAHAASKAAIERLSANTGAEFFQPCPDLGCKGNPETPSSQDQLGALRASETLATDAGVAGKTVDRVAQDESNNDTATINPQTFDNGAPLPSGIKWDGSTVSIRNDINSGTFFVWHADNGYDNGDGWYEPPFTEFDVPSLSSAAGLPVVWSTDCDSAKFDAPTSAVFPNVVPIDPRTSTSAGEEWLEGRGAVGFIGSSRDLNGFWGTQGLVHAGATLFPEAATRNWRAAFNLPLVQPVRQLGALVSAVDSIEMSETDMSADTGAQTAIFEWTLLGDPSMPIHRDKPSPFAKVPFTGTLQSVNDVSVHTTKSTANGALVTLVQDGQYIGRGIVSNGTADITTVQNVTDLSNLQVIASGDTFVPSAVTLG